MHHRTFRTFFVVTLLVSLTMLLSVTSAGAASHLKQAASSPTPVHQYSPNGRASASPHQVSTFTTPQVKGTGHGTIAARPAPGGRKSVGSPSNVLRVPAPAKTDVTTKVSFNGISATGWTPSDSNGAAGLQNYLEVVNEQFEIYSRTGSPQFGTTFNSWFGQSGSLFDPKAVWDNIGKRFIFLIDNNGNSLKLSVAQQTSGTGSYCNYDFPNVLSGYFADYPQLGVDVNGIYFTANLYPNSGPVITELFYAPRTAMEACQGFNYTFYWGLQNADGSGNSFTVVPAVEHTNPGTNTEYLVNTNGPGGGCSVTFWWLQSNGTLTNFNIGTQCYQPPPAAVQKGSSGTIETLDNRLYQAAYSNGLLSFDTVGSHDWGDGNGQVGIVEWFQINVGSATLANQGAFGTVGFWLFFPAFDVNSLGHMLFVYNSSGPTSFVNIWAISGCLCDTISVANGLAPYGTSGTARWGDYQSAWLDPKPTKTGALKGIWVTGQYAGSSDWATRTARLFPS